MDRSQVTNWGIGVSIKLRCLIRGFFTEHFTAPRIAILLVILSTSISDGPILPLLGAEVELSDFCYEM